MWPGADWQAFLKVHCKEGKEAKPWEVGQGLALGGQIYLTKGSLCSASHTKTELT